MPTPVEWLYYYDVTVGAQATGGQRDAQTIGLANGNYLVAWVEEANGTVGTTPGSDIIGKIYDAEGNVVRDAWRLNTARSSEGEFDFDLVATADGGFLISYSSGEYFGGDGGRVYWQRHDAAGETIDNALIADADGDDAYSGTQITIDLLTGNSVVTYQFNDTNFTFDQTIYGRIVSSDGVAGETFIAGLADGDFNNREENSDVAMLTGGRFVTAYYEEDEGVYNPEAQIFDNAGNLVTRIGIAASDFRTIDLQIAALSNGNWVATWCEFVGDDGDIFFRVFNSAGAPVTGVLTAAGFAADQRAPDVVALIDGDFVISWGVSGTSLAQRYNANGTPDGETFMVSPNHASTASGLTADGRLLFASDNSEGTIGDIHATIWDPRGTGIFGSLFPFGSRIFLDPVNFTTLPTSTLLVADEDANMILARGGDDSLFGAEGGDTILGREGEDSLDGGEGADSIEGNAGDDTIEGGQGSDVLNGGADRDTVSYAGSNAAVNVAINGDINANTGGHADGDALFGFEALAGSRFNDTLRAASTFSSAPYAAYGGGGNDSITGSGNSQTGGGADTLFGEAGLDTIFGGIGADSIDGGADNDSLNGGAGSDTVRGGAGADSIFGGASGFGVHSRDGRDQLFGDTGVDTLSGGVLDDTLDGGTGGDTLDGGAGIDLASYAESTKPLVADLKAPSQNTNEAAGDSYVDIENLAGSFFNDTLLGDNKANGLFGFSGHDSLDGRFGADSLDGGVGNDNLNGAEDNDTLRGAQGFDTLRGGNGADRFMLDSANPLDRDTILDFDGAADEIALTGAVFGLTPGALDPNAFAIGAFAADASDRIIYKPGDGKLFYDPDGTGAAAQVQIATLSKLPTLDASDFIVIGPPAAPLSASGGGGGFGLDAIMPAAAFESDGAPATASEPLARALCWLDEADLAASGANVWIA